MKKRLITAGIALCLSGIAFAGCGQFRGPFSQVTYQAKAKNAKKTALSCTGNAAYYTSTCSNVHFHSERFAAVCSPEHFETKALWVAINQAAYNMDKNQSVKNEQVLGKDCTYSEQGWHCEAWQPIKQLKIRYNDKQLEADDEAGRFTTINR